MRFVLALQTLGKCQLLSRIKLFVTSWTVQTLPGSSLHGILQARILNGQPFPSSGDLPDPGIEPRSSALQVDSLLSEPSGKEFLYLKGDHLVLPYYSVSSVVLGCIRAIERNRAASLTLRKTRLKGEVLRAKLRVCANLFPGDGSGGKSSWQVMPLGIRFERKRSPWLSFRTQGEFKPGYSNHRHLEATHPLSRTQRRQNSSSEGSPDQAQCFGFA